MFATFNEENNTSGFGEQDPKLEGEKMEQSSFRSSSLQFEGNQLVQVAVKVGSGQVQGGRHADGFGEIFIHQLIETI